MSHLRQPNFTTLQFLILWCSDCWVYNHSDRISNRIKMNLFWISIIVFAIGFIIWYILKFKMYNEFKSMGHTDKQKQEISHEITAV